MAEHRITTRVPAHETANTDLAIKVRADDQLLGELLISRGTIDWRPARSQHVFKVGWGKFDAMMQESGRRVRRP